MGSPDRYDFAFAALIVVVSFAPLFAVPGWQGSGPGGGASCNCGQYYLWFSPPTYGGDRPHVYDVYQGSHVDVMAVSDAQSTVDGLDLYANFTATPRVSGETLNVSYSSPSLNFTKRVTYGNGSVDVYYSFPRNVTTVLTFWRWYYSSVGTYSAPVDRAIPADRPVSFTFFAQGALFNASLTSSPNPVSAEIYGVQGQGLNKVTLTFTGTSVHVSIRLEGANPSAGAGSLQLAASEGAYPIIGVVVAGTFLGVRKWMVAKK